MIQNNVLLKKWRSLGVRLPFIFVFSYIILAVLVLFLVHTQFKKRMISDYTRMAEGVTNLMANELDASRISEYMEKNFSMEEYRRIVDRYYELEKNYYSKWGA